MNPGRVKVLLFGENAKRPSYLLRHLELCGCDCWFATSTEEGLALLRRHAFHLVVSTRPLQQASPMITLLGASDCSIFYSYPVEDGCWWLPLVRHGEKSMGAPALRPSEFVEVLDQMVRDIESDARAAAKEPQEVQS